MQAYVAYSIWIATISISTIVSYRVNHVAVLWNLYYSIPQFLYAYRWQLGNLVEPRFRWRGCGISPDDFIEADGPL